MKLVIDANILFSAAITEGKTSELILKDDIRLFAPEYLFQEFEKYEDTLNEKTNRSPGEFHKFMEILKGRIETVPKKEFEHKLGEAGEITPDKDDKQYFALAQHLNTAIWTDDKELQNQDIVEIITTTDLVQSLS